jgi:hypothetical protein
LLLVVVVEVTREAIMPEAVVLADYLRDFQV